MSEIMITNAPKTGLVLSGGGAKGAYQVGTLKALLELGANIDMVAGASMGALNGAVLACAPSLPEGVERLETLWNTLAARSPVEANTPAYLKLLASVGLAVGMPLPGVFAQVPALFQRIRWIGPAMLTTSNWLEASLLADAPLQALMDKYLDMDGLMRGLPLYVSVCKSGGGLVDVLRCIVAETGLVDTPPSEFLHVQSLPEQDRRNALLASAAIPMLYAARQIGDARYSDGGQGGWQTEQGNTPITPLIKAGCAQVIVTHLQNGSLWSRHDFPNTTVVEIRPQSPITPGNSLQDALSVALGFDPSHISRLIEQGYNDTMHCVGRVMRAVNTRQALRQSERAVGNSLRRGRAADADLDDAMSRLRGGIEAHNVS
jgi:NTE family protein